MEYSSYTIMSVLNIDQWCYRGCKCNHLWMKMPKFTILHLVRLMLWTLLISKYILTFLCQNVCFEKVSCLILVLFIGSSWRLKFFMVSTLVHLFYLTLIVWNCWNNPVRLCWIAKRFYPKRNFLLQILYINYQLNIV